MQIKTRRQFLGDLSLAAGAVAVSNLGCAVPPKGSIQATIDQIVFEMIGAPLAKTVDTIKIGDPKQPLKGIATTFLATYEIIEKAVQDGINLIITHEPIFYNHEDKTDWLKKDAVYQAKRDLCEKHGIVIWRCHDTIHSMRPDMIVTGMVAKLGWKVLQSPDHPLVFHLPEVTMAQLIGQLKETFGAKSFKVVGDPDLKISKVAVSVGAPGGNAQIQFMSHVQPDVLICGEIHEWETSEYVRDAIRTGSRTQGLVLLGHQFSEEAGMEAMAEWLKRLIPNQPIHFYQVKNPFKFV